MPDYTSERVAVVGGGIAGLACAHYLGREGSSITLFEASEQLGGLGTFFQRKEGTLERFYHCMLPSDRHLLALLDDIGLREQTYWKETSFGYMRDGRLFALNTPQDLLRFDPLPFMDRVRVGATGLWGSMRSDEGLDDITCVDWLTRLSGKRAFDTFWKPMLQAKFGDRYRNVPALWFWTRFNREKGSKKERKGYIQGGYRRIAQGLADSIKGTGGTIRMNAPVSRIDLAADGKVLVQVAGEPAQVFDRLVFTGPITVLARLFSGGKLAQHPAALDTGIDMQGVVNAVLLSRRGLSPHYWVAAPDAGIPFQGIVESTTLLDRRDTGGLHLIYLMNYLHRTDPRFSHDDDVILRDYVGGLRQLFPELLEDDIVESYAFRSPFVEPLYTLGYRRRMPPSTLLPGRIYLATTAQVYPDVTSWNGSTGLARRVVDQMMTERAALATTCF